MTNTDKAKAGFIKEYWENQAKRYKVSHTASWGDRHMIELEIETIGKYIPENSRVLDVGCANGYSTISQLSRHKLKPMVGIDVAENMIKQANIAKKRLGLKDKVSFELGDIKEIRFPGSSFDVVYTTRTIINLPTWQDQKRAVRECLRVTKPGGRFILSEAFREPLILLNSLRRIKSLPPLAEPSFNRYIRKALLERYLKSCKVKFKVDDFSSIYYLGTRFLREIVADAHKYNGYLTPFNKIFYKIEREFSGGGLGIQQVYVIYK